MMTSPAAAGDLANEKLMIVLDAEPDTEYPPVDVGTSQIQYTFDPLRVLPTMWTELCRDLPILIAAHGGCMSKAASND